MSAIYEVLTTNKNGDIVKALNDVEGIEKVNFNHKEQEGGKLIVTALSEGHIIPFLNSNIAGELNEQQFFVLFDDALHQKYVQEYMKIPRVKTHVKKNDVVNYGDKLIRLIDRASHSFKVGEWVKCSEEKFNPNMMVNTPDKYRLYPSDKTEYTQIPLVASILFASQSPKNKIFNELVEGRKFTQCVNIGNKFGASILYWAIVNNEFDTLKKRGICGELDDFQQIVDVRITNEGKFFERLIVTAAKHNLLSDFLELLIPSEDSDPTHLDFNTDKPNMKNTLDLGLNVNGKTLYEHLKLSNAKDKIITYFYNCKKLMVNIVGPDIKNMLDHMKQETFLKKSSENGMGCLLKYNICVRKDQFSEWYVIETVKCTIQDQSTSTTDALKLYETDVIDLEDLIEDYEARDEDGAFLLYGENTLLSLEPVMRHDAVKVELFGVAEEF